MTFVAGQVLTAAQLNALDITSLTVDTDTLVVDATNDRVGINTASPSVALDVGGSVVIDDTLAVDTDTLFTNGAGQVGIGTTTPTANHVLHTHGAVLISSTTGVGNSHFPFTDGRFYYTADPETGGTGDHVFRHYSGGSYVEQMRILENGRVGINTNSPGYQLDVNGNLRSQSHIDVTSGTNNQLRLTATTTSGRPYLTINNWNGSSYVRRGYIGYPAAGSSTANINIVADNGDINIAPELTINSGPKLSDPSTANELRVTTAHGYIDLGPKNSSYCHIYTDRTRFYFNKGVDSAPYLYWRNSSGIGGPLTDVSSTSLMRYVLQSTLYGTFFDYTSIRDRKERITNVTAEDSGRWIDALQPVTYIERWLGDEDEPADVQQWREADMQVGFIADDVLASADASHFAQAYDDGEGGLDPAGWKWECVIAAAVAEIKSLRARVATLEAT